MKNSTIWISGSILGLAVIYLGQTGEKQIIITAPTVAVVSDIITVKPTKAVAEGMSILKPTEKTQSSVVEASIPTQHLMPESDPVAVDKAFSYSVSIKGDMIDVNIEILKGYKVYEDKVSVWIDDEKVNLEKYIKSSTIEIEDPTQGTVMVYKDNFNAQIKPNSEKKSIKIKTSYQGCWDGGVCYPPMTKETTLSF